MKAKLSATEKNTILKFIHKKEAGIYLMNVTTPTEYYFNSFDRNEDNKLVKKYNPMTDKKEYLWDGTFSYMSKFFLEQYEWFYDGKQFHWCDDLLEKYYGK